MLQDSFCIFTNTVALNFILHICKLCRSSFCVFANCILYTAEFHSGYLQYTQSQLRQNFILLIRRLRKMSFRSLKNYTEFHVYPNSAYCHSAYSQTTTTGDTLGQIQKQLLKKEIVRYIQSQIERTHYNIVWYLTLKRKNIQGNLRILGMTMQNE